MTRKKKITLKQAVIEVIRRNISVGYSPRIFLLRTENGKAKDLSGEISKMVKSRAAVDFVLKEIKDKEGNNILTIEDFIVENDFGLPPDVVKKAKENLERYNKARKSVKK